MRGIWMMKESSLLSHRLTKILPHIIDVVLLLSAVLLTFSIDQYPFYNDWLSVKVLSLFVYIFLGMFAFKWAKTKPIKVAFWLAAVAVFFYIVSVAMNKTPLWFVD